MNIIPENKSDIEAGEKLLLACDSDVVDNLGEIMEWTQDINWPVAIHVYQRLSSLGAELVDPIREILEGSDSSWKYFLISNLISNLDVEVYGLLTPDLQKLVVTPTEADIAEEVNLVAKEALIRTKK